MLIIVTVRKARSALCVAPCPCCLFSRRLKKRRVYERFRLFRPNEKCKHFVGSYALLNSCDYAQSAISALRRSLPLLLVFSYTQKASPGGQSRLLFRPNENAEGILSDFTPLLIVVTVRKARSALALLSAFEICIMKHALFSKNQLLRYFVGSKTDTFANSTYFISFKTYNFTYIVIFVSSKTDKIIDKHTFRYYNDGILNDGVLL